MKAELPDRTAVGEIFRIRGTGSRTVTFRTASARPKADGSFAVIWTGCGATCSAHTRNVVEESRLTNGDGTEARLRSELLKSARTGPGSGGSTASAKSEQLPASCVALAGSIDNVGAPAT
jgi:hypothetical protein